MSASHWSWSWSSFIVVFYSSFCCCLLVALLLFFFLISCCDIFMSCQRGWRCRFRHFDGLCRLALLPSCCYDVLLRVAAAAVVDVAVVGDVAVVYVAVVACLPALLTAQ